ncbi:MAG TPA: MerR family transcriptional regulator [Acidimicrobiales bacterium]|nr:MerR family transcriptional regulator [Acidimicrobiales bacterium]
MVDHAGPEHRIDELARLAGTTVRNVRAYQDRGLLPPPRRQGRTGYYSDAHLARLRLIGQLLERGYGLANIHELLEAWESGQNVGELLGLEAALSAPWSEEPAQVVGPEDLASMFGGTGVGGADPDPATVLRAAEDAVAAGILEPQDGGFLVKRPGLLRIGAELAAAGIPLDAVLALGRHLFQDIDVVASRFVDLVLVHVFDPVGEPIPSAEVPRLAEVVRRLRPLAEQAVDVVLADAMERHVRDELRDRLGRMLPGRETEAS